MAGSAFRQRRDGNLYGNLDKPGPYLVIIRWNPGWFSAPHDYGTGRICVVVSGTWWVNSGANCTPRHAVPVWSGGFVLRHARTWHYDGVPADGKNRLWSLSSGWAR